MGWKKITGIIITILGIAMFSFGTYISYKVAAGEKQIESAESKIKSGSGILSLIPGTDEIEQNVADSAQKKIDKGQALINKYSLIARYLNIAGMAAILIGCLLIVLSYVHLHKQ
jgi:hypothetical protein